MPVSPTTLTVNRNNWTGRDGTVTLNEDGTIYVEDIGLFRFIETEEPTNDGGKYDAWLWNLVSADGEWSPDTVLARGCLFRCDIAKYEAGPVPYTHARAIEAARVLWNTV